MIENIQWLGHGSFLIQGPPFIYINPWRVVRHAFHPDVILISHDHYDHCSVADVQKLRGAETLVIGNERVAQQIEGTTILRPWQSMTIEHMSLKAIPAYSTVGTQHPKEHGGLGFILSMKLYDIYYAGDTKIIPEMESIHPDIVILPIDNDDTLSVDEAAKVVEMLRPRWVYPSNWGATGEGASSIDVTRFKELVGGRAEVIIPKPNQTLKDEI
jgi:L-ascorbate metabolism protein UlaG (beta-lactamase superfamily)